MNEELEQPDGNKDQLNEEQQKSDSNQDQLIEIYKLQAQLSDNISNRRITINRFYILVIAGLSLVFPTFFKLPVEIRNVVSIDYLIAGLVLLGITVSVAWFVSINSNLRLVMIKYEALKNLENELEYQFFKDEWNFLEKYGKHRTYWEVSYIEIFVPVFFFVVFSFILYVSLNPLSKIIFTLYPSFVTGFFCTVGLNSWQIDREIRGLKKWTDTQIRRISIIIIVVYLFLMILLPNFMGGVSMPTKEAESVDEQPTETSLKTNSEETAKKQIILSDRKETESVNAGPTETDSEEEAGKPNGSQ